MSRFPWEVLLALVVAGFFTWLLFTPYVAQVSQGLAAGASKSVVISVVVILFVVAGGYLVATARRSRS